MNRIFILIAATLLVSAGAFAQNAPPPLPPPSDGGPQVMIYRSTFDPAPGGGGTIATGMATGNAGFFSIELPGNGKPIANAPYTATALTEMTQILGDGNRIVNKSSASMARDSQGRTRREETMGMVGPWQGNGNKLIFINDPVTQINYVLDPEKQTATTMKLPTFTSAIPAGPEPGIGAKFVEKRLIGEQPEEAKTEVLGTQTMEGVAVEGKRVTRTIPTGQVGNVQPIQIISEVWFSPDLQMVIMSKHSDPRFGETSYQLTGIQRGEPDKSLFEVPSSYTVKNMPAPMLPHLSTAPGGEPGPVGFVGNVNSGGK